MSATRCGISAMQLMRETGVTYKCAWRMFNLIRKMLLEDVHGLGGEKVVEADETFIGGTRHRHEMRTRKHATVAAIVERGGRVVAKVVPDRSLTYLTGGIRKYVSVKSTVYTDEAPQYKWLPRFGYGHKSVKHLARVYVQGDVHTNTIEGYFGNVKRGISGVYHSVSKKHLQGYLDEYAFRYNHRDDGKPMFRAFFAQVSTDFVERHFPEKHRPRKIA